MNKESAKDQTFMELQQHKSDKKRFWIRMHQNHGNLQLSYMGHDVGFDHSINKRGTSPQNTHQQTSISQTHNCKSIRSNWSSINYEDPHHTKAYPKPEANRHNHVQSTDVIQTSRNQPTTIFKMMQKLSGLLLYGAVPWHPTWLFSTLHYMYLPKKKQHKNKTVRHGRPSTTLEYTKGAEGKKKHKLPTLSWYLGCQGWKHHMLLVNFWKGGGHFPVTTLLTVLHYCWELQRSSSLVNVVSSMCKLYWVLHILGWYYSVSSLWFPLH